MCARAGQCPCYLRQRHWSRSHGPGSRRFTPPRASRCSRFPRAPGRAACPADQVEILPDHIRLTLGLRDILVLRNHDDVPQIFGPTLMMPGQSFRLPFERPAEYQFACTAHASGQMTINVEPNPATPLARILWRARAALQR